MLHDPVCGRRIKRNRAYVAFDYQGTTYYLCCPRCQAEFERAPQEFARVEWGESAARGNQTTRANPLRTTISIVHGPRR